MMNEYGHPVLLLTQHSGDTVSDMTFGGRAYRAQRGGLRQEAIHTEAGDFMPVSPPQEEKPAYFAKEIYDSQRSLRGNPSTRSARDAEQMI